MAPRSDMSAAAAPHTGAGAAPALGLLARAFAALRHVDPHAHAAWVYDLDLLRMRARRFTAAFAPARPLAAYALKANALPVLLEALAGEGLGADAGSLGELEAAARAGFPAERRVLNGNGRTAEEAEWVARHGVALVNADHVGELDLLDRAAADAGNPLRVALRINPGIATPGHHYVATGHDEAKFGVSLAEAIEALRDRARWPALQLDGIHVHVGSQLMDPAPMAQALDAVLALADEVAAAGAPLGVLNLGGGFGLDYEGVREFPLEEWAGLVHDRTRGRGEQLVVEPGRWIVAPAGALVAEVLWVKVRSGRRFVVLGAGMNDLLRPALYHARHRIVPLAPSGEPATPADVVGPVCESGDVFAREVMLPPLERGDLVAILDAGAYGAVMSSNYNGRGRLAEIVCSGDTLTLARAAESDSEPARRDRAQQLE